MLGRRGFASIAIVSMLAAIACHTREDTARSIGRRGAFRAGETCPPDASAFETCVESTCRAECAPFADSTTLTEACMSKCARQGTCDSDADCAADSVCVMIAPRLRRCQARSDAAY